MNAAICLVVCCLLAAPSQADGVIRLGEARFLLTSDWASVREALGPSRVPWAFDVLGVSQELPFSWHAHAYLVATVNRGDLLRGPLAELEATYQGRSRAWRLLPGETSWAQIAVAPGAPLTTFTESDRGRPFLLRGTFTDDELREIYSVLVAGRPFADSAAEIIKSWGLGPLAALRRVGPLEVSAELWQHTTVKLERRVNQWVIASMQVSVP